MKTKSTGFSVIALKTKIVAGFMVCCFSLNAQSIVGKWKMTSAKETLTDKSSGQKKDFTAQLGDIIKKIDQVIEFHADNTYLTLNTMQRAGKHFEVTGAYSVSGDQIKLKPAKTKNAAIINSKFAENPLSSRLPGTITIVSKTGNTLVLHYGSERTADGKTFVVDIEDTFQKQ